MAKHGNRRRHRHRHHRPRVGRHQGAQHAAAALVGVAVLRHHRVGVRLLDRLSGLADHQRLHDRRAGLFDARRGGGRSRRSAEGARRQGRGAANRRRSPTSRRIRRCSPSRRRRARPPSATIARRATASARPARKAIRTSTTTTGCGAARSTAIQRDHRVRRALRPSRRRTKARCRRSARTACSSRDEIVVVANYVRSLSGLAGASRHRSRRGQEDFRR